MNIAKVALVLLLPPLAGHCLPAQIQPHALFSDNMVLQRGKPVPVWGTAAPGADVTVSLGKQRMLAVADDAGRWQVELQPLSVGDGNEILFSSRNTEFAVRNVLIGEVWVCSGQSNMGLKLRQTARGTEEIPKANHPRIRLFTVPMKTARSPQREIEGKWQICSPDVAKDFSGVGYYFGRQLMEKLDVPIGLIQTAWGGSRAEAWTSKEAMADPAFRAILEHWAEVEEEQPKRIEEYATKLKRWEKASAKAKQEGKKAPRKPVHPTSNRSPQSPLSLHRESNIYNAMLAPLIPYAMRGVIWYQGEANVGRAWQYRKLFPTMISDWRAQWRQGDFPFLYVQLAAFRYKRYDPLACAELWEAQAKALELANTGMASAVDLGNHKNIHPKNKWDVALRLSLWARKLAYGEKDLVCSGPIYKSAKVEGQQIRIGFDHVGGGLLAKGGELGEFTIAGKDQKFHPARATIEHGAAAGGGTDTDTVLVSSPKVPEPVAVRYAWHDTPTLTLYNKEGLPASPFRTDSFDAVTLGKESPEDKANQTDKK